MFPRIQSILNSVVDGGSCSGWRCGKRTSKEDDEFVEGVVRESHSSPAAQRPTNLESIDIQQSRGNDPIDTQPKASRSMEMSRLTGVDQGKKKDKEKSQDENRSQDKDRSQDKNEPEFSRSAEVQAHSQAASQ